MKILFIIFTILSADVFACGFYSASNGWGTKSQNELDDTYSKCPPPRERTPQEEAESQRLYEDTRRIGDAVEQGRLDQLSPSERISAVEFYGANPEQLSNQELETLISRTQNMIDQPSSGSLSMERMEAVMDLDKKAKLYKKILAKREATEQTLSQVSLNNHRKKPAAYGENNPTASAVSSPKPESVQPQLAAVSSLFESFSPSKTSGSQGSGGSMSSQERFQSLFQKIQAQLQEITNSFGN